MTGRRKIDNDDNNNDTDITSTALTSDNITNVIILIELANMYTLFQNSRNKNRSKNEDLTQEIETGR